VAGVYGGCFGVSIDILHLFLRRKAGDGDAIGGGMWIGGRSFEKSSHLLVEPLGKMAFLSTIWGHNRGAHCHQKAAAFYYSCCLLLFRKAFAGIKVIKLASKPSYVSTRSRESDKSEYTATPHNLKP
jgi:hypothetical protein